MKSITAYEIKNGDNIELTNGHQFFDVIVEPDLHDESKIFVYGLDKATTLGASQLVYLLGRPQ